MALLGAAAATLAVKFGKDSVKGFVEAQAAQTRLSDAFQKFPALADTNIDRLRALNTELAKKTRFDDDATASGQAVLAQFNLTGSQIETLTPLLQDYAAKTGRDLPSAASTLGKAFLGNTRALKELGVNYKATGDQATDTANITQILRDKVGGFATKEGKTAAGQAEILKNQWGELEESAGSKLVPALTKLAGVLTDVIGFTQKYSKIIVPLALVLGGFAGTIWAINAATKAYTAVQLALNSALFANPIGLVILAVAALVAGLVIAYNKSETFRKVVDGAFSAVAAAGKLMWNALKSAFKFIVDAWFTLTGAIIHGAAKAFGWVPGIGPKLKKAADEFDHFRDRVNASLSGIQRTIPISFVAIGTSAPNSRYAGKQLPIDGKVTTSSDSYHLKRMADAVAGPTDSVKRLRQHSYQQFGVT